MSDEKGKVGRPKSVGETTVARLQEGTLDRIKGVLHEGETQAEFIRSAIGKEISRRRLRQLNLQSSGPTSKETAAERERLMTAIKDVGEAPVTRSEFDDLEDRVDQIEAALHART